MYTENSPHAVVTWTAGGVSAKEVFKEIDKGMF
jgi:hypothetical protein